MYTTRPLSHYQDCPEALTLLPEGPNSYYLVLQGEKTITTTSFFGFFKDTKTIKNWLIGDLPFPQNRRLSIIRGSDDRSRRTHDDYLIPVINQPLSSNQYYAIKADRRQREEAYASSKDIDVFCFCICIPDEELRPFNQDDVYQRFEFSVTNSTSSRNVYMPTANSVALDGDPPMVLCTKKCQMKSNSPENFYIGEARGIDSSLRAHLPDFNLWTSQVCPKPVVAGKWYCPFIFIKDGRRKDQVKENLFYEMTLEQQWEQIYAAERRYNQGKKVTVNMIVPTESVKIAGQEATKEDRNNTIGVVWFKSTDESGMDEVFIGLSTLIVERMMWEQERVGWNKEKGQRVRVVKDETYEGTGDWKRFGCYLLVESFVLKRNNRRILLTYDFRHTHQIRSKWD